MDARDAAAAVRGLRDGHDIMGRSMQVSFARTERKTPDEMARDDRFGGSGGGDRRR